MSAREEDRDLVRLLLGLADHMDDGLPVRGFSGLPRRAARRIVELSPASVDRQTDRRSTCAACGEALTQAHTGRPREFCSTRCRNRARNERNRTVET